MKEPGFSIPAFALILLYSGGAAAALAPQYDRWTELQSVLADESIPRRLGEQGPVDRIEVKPGGIYRVWARRCYVDVTIKNGSDRSVVPGGQSISGVAIGDAHCT